MIRLITQPSQMKQSLKFTEFSGDILSRPQTCSPTSIPSSGGIRHRFIRRIGRATICNSAMRVPIFIGSVPFSID